MSQEVEQMIVHLLEKELRRRSRPLCGHTLEHAQARISIPPEDPGQVAVWFHCNWCHQEYLRTTPITPEIEYEARSVLRKQQPISLDEMIDVHDILAGWDRPLKDLFNAG